MTDWFQRLLAKLFPFRPTSHAAKVDALLNLPKAGSGTKTSKAAS